MAGFNKFSPCCNCGCTTRLCLTGYVYDHNPLTSGVRYDPNMGADYAGVHKTNGSKEISFALYNSSGVFYAVLSTGASGAGQSPLYQCSSIQNNIFPIVSGTTPTQYATSGFFYTQPLGCHVPTGTPFDCGYIDGYAYGFQSGNRIPIENIWFNVMIGTAVQQTLQTDSAGHVRFSGILTQQINGYTVRSSGLNYPTQSISIPNLYCNAVANFYSGIITPDYLLTCSTGNYYGRYLTQCTDNSGILEANFDCSPANCFTCGLLAPIGNESGTSILKDPIIMGTPWGTVNLPFTTNVSPFGNTWSKTAMLSISSMTCTDLSGHPSCPDICPTSATSKTANQSITLSSGTFDFLLTCTTVSGSAALVLDITMPSMSHSTATNPTDACTTRDPSSVQDNFTCGYELGTNNNIVLFPRTRMAPSVGPDVPFGNLPNYGCYNNYVTCSVSGTCNDGFGVPHSCVQKIDGAIDVYNIFKLSSRCKIREAYKLLNCNLDILSLLDITMTCSTEYNPSTMQVCCSGFDPASFTVTFTD